MASFKNNIFIWLSGADPETLQNTSESEKRKFVKLGLTIIIPAIMGWAGMWFASPYIGIDGTVRYIVPSFWSLIILIIDTYLVSSLNKKTNNGNNKGYYSLAGFRILLAVFVGLVISHPIVLKVLEKNIDEEIQKMKRHEVFELISANRDTAATWSRGLNNENAALDSMINCKEKLSKAEAGGIILELPCGTSSGERHTGVLYKRLLKEISDLQIRRNDNLDSILQIQNNLENRTRFDTSNLNKTYSSDYLKRMQALNRLESNDQSAKPTKLLVYVLLFFFILLDSIAVISKVVTSSGEYERIFEESSLSKIEIAITKYRIKNELSAETYQNDKNFRTQIINAIYSNSNDYTPQQIWSGVSRIIENFGQENIINSNIPIPNEQRLKPLRLIIFLTTSMIFGCVFWYFLKITLFKNSNDEIAIAMGLYSTSVSIIAAYLLRN